MKFNIFSNIIRCYKAMSYFSPNLNIWIITQTILLLVSRTTVALFSLALSYFVNKINHITITDSIIIGVVSFYTINRMLEWLLSSIHSRLHTQFILPCGFKFIDEIIYLMLKNYSILNIDKNPVQLSHLLNKKTEARGFLGFLFHHIATPVFELIVCAILIIKLGFGWLGILLIPACIIHLVISISLIPKIKHKLLKVLAMNAKTSSLFASSLEKANLANVFTTTEVLIDYLKSLTKAETEEFKKSSLLNDFLATTINLPLAIFACIFFYYGTQQVNNGLATYGGFAAFISIIMNSFFQLKNLTFAFDGLTQSITALEIHLEIFEQIKTKGNIDSNNTLIDFKELRLKDFSIKMNNVKHNKFNFTLKKGEALFVVGRSGTGKSSLINGMLGYLPFEGEILINEKKNQSNIFCWMPQEFQAIEGTIKLNLLLGNKLATEEQMWNVLEKVNLSQKIKNLGGLESHIHHNGNNLSGGENQRLSLARTMLSDHPVLILDEPSSAMDVYLEKEIFREILDMKKTCIMIVHKLKAIPENSMILFIKNEREYIIDTIEKLINEDDDFKKLYFINEK